MTGSAVTGARPSVLRSTVVQWGAKCLTLLLALVSIAVTTRVVGPEDYGRLALAGTFVGVLAVAVDWGLPLLVSREISKGGGEYDTIVGSALVGRLVLTPVAVAVGTGAAVLLYGNDRVVVLGVALGLLGLVPGTVISAVGCVYQESGRLGTLALVETGFRAGGLVATIVVLASGGGVLTLLGAGVAVSVGHAVVACRLLPRADLRTYWTAYDGRVFRRTLLASLPLGIALWLNVLYARVDVLMLSLIEDLEAVALYTTAYRLMEMLLVFPSLFAMAAFPVLSRSASDPAQLARLISRGMRFTVLFIVPLGTAQAIWSEELVSLVGGDQFLGAGPVLAVLGLATVVSGANILLGLVIIALDRQRRALWLNITGLLLNVALNLWLIPAHGAVGAAVATVTAEAFVMVSAVIIVTRATGLPIDVRGPASTLTAAAAAALSAVAIQGPTVVEAAGFIAVYAAGVLGLRVVDKADLERVRRGATPP